MKRTIRLLFLALLLTLAVCVGVSAVSPQSCAEELSTIHVFRGTDTGFELDRAPRRSEAAVMLVRLFGAEDQAQSDYATGVTSHPFEDGNGWCAPYLAWLYTNNMVKGVTPTQYRVDATCSARDYALFLLRALGYQDGVDFDWAQTESFATACGFYAPALFDGTFTRGDLALMTYLALQTQRADGSGTLLAALSEMGAIDQSASRALEESFRKNPLHVSDGEVSLDASAWRTASRELTIEVQFDTGSETLSPNELQALVIPDATGRARIDTDALAALVERWAQQYNTYDVPFLFDSYVKGITPISFVRCDYRLDTASIVKQLTQAIIAMEPCQLRATLRCYRWGAPFDISQTHVEIDLDNQQLTFIKNGTVIVNTDIVTGLVTSRQTPTGLYEAHHKQTNCTLVGSDYEVFVKYWVSVIEERIGLHDASWRSVFGGDEYVNNGSHGCVNIPEAAMVKIFNNIEDGTPVLIFGQNRWYEPGSADSPATKNPLRGTTAN